MAAEEIGSIGGISFGPNRRGNQAGGGGPTHDRPRRRPGLDRIALTEPRRAALRLLRERVLAATAAGLELSRSPHRQPLQPAVPTDSARAFLGRLISDQNRLAARRRVTWPESRIARALEDGMTDGLGETLDILDELGDLDAETWRLVCTVLAEFQRKILLAGFGDAP